MQRNCASAVLTRGQPEMAVRLGLAHASFVLRRSWHAASGLITRLPISLSPAQRTLRLLPLISNCS